MHKMKPYKDILFVTGNEPIHNFFVEKVIEELAVKHFDVVKYYSGISNFDYFSKIYDYEQMNVSERAYFSDFLKRRTEIISRKDICFRYDNEAIFNSIAHFNEYLDKIIGQTHYKVILSFACPVITSDSFFQEDMQTVNIHMGLSKYYRGGDSNIFALDKQEYDRVGLTAHKLAKYVDSGHILFELSLADIEERDYRQSKIMELTLNLMTEAIIILTTKIKSSQLIYSAKPDLKSTFNLKNSNITIENIINAERNLSLRHSRLHNKT